MSNFIESYVGNNFTNATNSFAAGMNFTNLIIAIPLLTTFILLVINSIRSPRKPKILDTKFQIITLISYVLFVAIAIYYKNLPGVIINIYNWLKLLLINHSVIIVLAYIPFMFFAWCIYDDNTQNSEKAADKYENSELKKIIKDKITQLQNKDKSQNILINGHWGSGKTNFTKNTLSKPINSSIYLSCTDYPDMFELVNALVYKSNNFIMRQLIRFSLGKLLSIISKTELRQYIGNKKVIILDEFERLVDYNKIDHMHIVSLIQYLNSEKNCICVLVANEDHINNANQFTNVREKLISYTYNYKIQFDDVIKIIHEKYQEALYASNKQNSTVEQIVKLTLKNPDDHKNEFSHIYQEFEKWYNLDNNIRMIEHLYIKINQLYQATLQMIDEDEFYRSRYTSEVQKNKLFTGLFGYVETIIIQLYYLYLKNPYNLTAIEYLATIYQYDRTSKTTNTINDVARQVIRKLNHSEENTSLEIQSTASKTLTLQYVERDLIQNFALGYINHDIIEYESKNIKYYDKSYHLHYILTNQSFENINDKLIKDYLGQEEQIIQLLPFQKVRTTFSQKLKFFMREFKNVVCESDNPTTVINYFKSINILEERFLRIVHDIDLPFDDSIIIDYIEYCKYINKPSTQINPNNIRPVSYNPVAYINALIIQSINDSTIDNLALIIDKIVDFTNVQTLIGAIYELTCTQAVKQNKVHTFIDIIKQISSKLATNNYHTTHLLYFMYQSYTELKAAIRTDNSKNSDEEKTKQAMEALDSCNTNLIMIFTKDSYTEDNLLFALFNGLSQFNDDVLRATPLQHFVNKINEIYNTDILKQEFIDTYKNHIWSIPKQVAEALQTELDTATEQPSNPTQENPDDKK